MEDGREIVIGASGLTASPSPSATST